MEEKIEVRTYADEWVTAERVTIFGERCIAYRASGNIVTLRESERWLAGRLRIAPATIKLPSWEAANIGDLCAMSRGGWIGKVKSFAAGRIYYELWDGTAWHGGSSDGFISSPGMPDYHLSRLATAAEIAATAIPIADIPDRMRGEVERLRKPVPYDLASFPPQMTRVRRTSARAGWGSAILSVGGSAIRINDVSILWDTLATEYEMTADGHTWLACSRSPCGVRDGKGAA